MQLLALNRRTLATLSSPDAARLHMMLTRKRLALAACGIAVVAAATWALWPKAIAVDLATATRGPMSVTVEEEGKTRIRNVFVVSAPQSGKMLRSPLLAGDLVEKGRTVVAIIQPTPPPFLDMRTQLEATAQSEAAAAGVRLADAELAQARSELTFAESELVRAKVLSRTNTISARTLERATLEVDVRRAAVAKAEANRAVRQRELEAARARLVSPVEDMLASPLGAGCCIDVRSPEDGRVLKVLVTSEQAVQMGTPLVEIGNPGEQEIIVDLLSTDAVRVREGALATIDGWGDSRSLPAKVRRIESAGFTKVSALGIEEQRVRVVLDFDPPRDQQVRLGHEFRVFVRIRVWDSEDVTRVPVGALFRQDGRWSVFKLKDNRAWSTTIEINHRNAETAEVTGGLASGDRVILHPSDRVQSGVRVVERITAAN